MNQEALNRLFDFGPSGGLRSSELCTLFGTKQFILLLLDDSKQLQFLHRTSEEGQYGKPITPARYWCGRDGQSVARLIAVLQEFSVQDISDVMRELNARILKESDV